MLIFGGRPSGLQLKAVEARIAAGLSRLFELPRTWKRLIQLTADTLLIVFSYVTALVLATESVAVLGGWRVWAAPAAAAFFSLLVFYRLGFYRQVVRALGGQALLSLVEGVGVSAIFVSVSALLFGAPASLALAIIYSLIAFCTVGGVRFLLRAIYWRTRQRAKTRVIIYGAGQSGRELLSSLQSGPDYAPVCFIDDARELHGQQIGGMTVYSPARLPALIHEFNARVVLLAMPSLKRAERAAIVARIEHLPVRVQIMPGIGDMVEGRGNPESPKGIREVTVEDLLGRDPIDPDPALMAPTLAGKSVMVTGAGGSIGSELCRQILRQRPRMLVLLELSEFALYQIDDELKGAAAAAGVRVVPLLGSAGDTDRVASILRQFGVETIYHAAAYKHMPIVEQNIVEGLSNNLFGTLSIARAAVAAGVQNFILISTDKAVRPTNIMGASKRMAELICQALGAEAGRTRFCIVRFGNVLGSSGSVIPRFRRMIEAGGPVAVTHPDIARYFMTVTEAAQLVIQAGGMARGGDVFVLDMGQPVRIVDLAQRMIRLSGYVPVIARSADEAAALKGGDRIPIVFTEMRPGEKLVEELLTSGHAMPTRHPRILTTMEDAWPWERLVRILDHLREACRAEDLPRVRALLARAPTGYRPSDPIVDLTWTDLDSIRGTASPALAPPQPAVADALLDRIAERLVAHRPEPARSAPSQPAGTPAHPPARRDRPVPSQAAAVTGTAAGS